jgi:hypothetical protein
MQRKPGLLMGAFIGGLLMIPVVALSFLGQQFAGFPFIPNILFSFGRDNAPGELVPRVIQFMSNTIISLNIGRVDVVAKQVEFFLEWTTLLVLGIVAGAIFFVALRRMQKPRNDSFPGIGLGLMVAVIVLGMMATLPYISNADPAVAIVWIAVLLIGWGIAVGSVYNTLAYRTAAPHGDEAPAYAQVIDRRQFLVRVGAASATITVVGAGLGALLNPRDADFIEPLAQPDATPNVDMAALPNADDPVTPAPGTRLEITPLEDHYRIDITTVPPRIEPVGYVLPFTTAITEDGSVQTVAELTLDDIRAYESRQDYLTMSCISNQVGGSLISTIKWTGVSMQRLLADIEIPATATHIKITAADGFDETIALALIEEDERVMLAYEWEDQPLTVEHGFPLRIHIPNHYGMKQPKWITGMEFIAGDQDGYWVRRGWDKQALVLATSVVDTVATDAIFENEDGEQLIPVGGIAWAGDRGIRRVEVSVDDGDWVEAQLRAPVSDRTWQIWRYDWAFSEGTHTFRVRCVDGNGSAQIERAQGTFPSGATGIDSARAVVESATA